MLEFYLVLGVKRVVRSVSWPNMLNFNTRTVSAKSLELQRTLYLYKRESIQVLECDIIKYVVSR